MSWPLVKLGEAPLKISDGNYSSKYPKASEFLDSGIPFLSGYNIVDGIVDETDCKFISDKLHSELKKGHVKTGDVLITTRGNIGNTAIVPARLDDVNINAQLVLLRPAQDKIDSNYLKHIFSSPSVARQITSGLTGSALKQLPIRSLKEIEIPLPPLEEQKRIAAILDKADSVRRKRQQAIDLADDFLRSVFLDMFGDPVKNPKEWKSKKLGDLCAVGSSKRVFVDDFVESGIPFYRGTEVGKLGNDEQIEPSLFISQEHYQALKDHGGVPQVGDLLLPSICPDGRIWQVNHLEPFYFKDGRVLWIKSGDSDVNSDFLRSLLQRIFFANYSQIASGTTFAELKIVALKNLDILVPPIDKQIEFSNVMRKTMANIETLNLAKKQAEEMFNSSSQKAFAGEL